MRRLLTFVLLTAFVVALGSVRQGTVRWSSGDRSAADTAAAGRVDTSHPIHDGTYWRGAQATSAVATSPWRVHELHAHFATLSVFFRFALVHAPTGRLADSPRSHAPPHSLNDSLRI